MNIHSDCEIIIGLKTENKYINMTDEGKEGEIKTGVLENIKIINQKTRKVMEKKQFIVEDKTKNRRNCRKFADRRRNSP